MKRLFALLLTLSLLALPAFGEEETKRVYRRGETEPFGAEEALLQLRVCPLLGADSMLLTLGDHSMLIDMGIDSDVPAVARMVNLDARLTQLEYAFSTHPHSDHIGGLPGLLSYVSIGTFFTAFPLDYQDNTGPDVRQIRAVRALQAAGVPIESVQAGDEIPFGDAKITVLRQEKYTTNNQSAMLLVEYGACRLLLTADVENQGQAALLRNWDVRADIMKFPHHGVTAMDQGFLSAVNPELAFFTHGSENTKDAQWQLRRIGVPCLFATWGTITLASNGEKWIVSQDVSPKMVAYAARYRLE